jgi:pyruvate dehydrogenase E1 component beta subunit
MEHKTLWGLTGEVDVTQTATLGHAQTLRSGQHLTLVSWSKQVHACVQACEQLAQAGIEVELIDLRSIWPWDREAVLASCAKTGHLLVVHEAVQAAGFGAEIAATVAETIGCKVKRLGAPRIPVGYAPVLEAQSRVLAADIAVAARSLLN